MKLNAVLVLVGSLLLAFSLQAQDKPTVFLVGDSTVKNGQGDGGGGLWGWGNAFGLYLDTDKITVENRAMGGMSSRTYYHAEYLWGQVRDQLKAGDYVIIQLGHNDGGGLSGFFATRATLPGTGEETQEVEPPNTQQKEVVHTYGWYLRQYIREAREKGAIPIVCSPIPRNDWVEGKMPPYTKDSYAQWSADVAAQEKVGFIDLYERSRQALQALGQEAVMDQYYPSSDHTHTLAKGAMLHASLVAAGLRDIPGCTLVPYLLEKPSGTFPIKKKLFIIGDSTVADGSGAIVGWGKPIVTMFDTTRISVFNHARGGRSSRTFLTEGLWDRVLSELGPGDFILMGFGHNDGNPQVRGSMFGNSDDTLVITRPDGSSEVVHTYGWYMTKFVREAKAKGAIPILFSQIPWRELYDGKSKRSTETFGKWLGEVAEAEEVFYVQLNELVADKYEAMGQEQVNAFFPGDHTHTNLEGATFNARTLIEGIMALRRCPLRGYVLRTPPAQ